MSKVKGLIDKLEMYKKYTSRDYRGKDIKTTYQVIALYDQIIKELRYRVPTAPIDIQETSFRCPTCKTVWQIEDGCTADDYTMCGACGQFYKGF